MLKGFFSLWWKRGGGKEKGRRGEEGNTIHLFPSPPSLFWEGKEATSWEDVEKAFSSTRIFRGASPEEEEGG